MAQKRTERATPERGEGLRERVLRASQELIEEQGLAALSMREVARRAGVSHQAPYNHFEDREAILAALAEDGFNGLQERFREVLGEARKEPGAVAMVKAMCRAYIEFAVARPAHFRVMFRPELVDLERCVAAREAGDSAFAYLHASVAELTEEGFLPGVPAEVVATLSTGPSRARCRWSCPR
jgi:AcrR family transcriptional regulator